MEAIVYRQRVGEAALLVAVLIECLKQDLILHPGSPVAQFVDYYNVDVERIRQGMEEGLVTAKGVREALTQIAR